MNDMVYIVAALMLAGFFYLRSVVWKRRYQEAVEFKAEWPDVGV